MKPTGREFPSEPLSVPEPGMMLLVGGGVAASLARRLRVRR
ncbi:MAG: PEP-CTERM sorting domain-containing protein [Acidobacteria bacterium]|nr:PEP-CTERM sorting domain-containing protein [Acidobacteriota bacterium]